MLNRRLYRDHFWQVINDRITKRNKLPLSPPPSEKPLADTQTKHKTKPYKFNRSIYTHTKRERDTITHLR